MFLPHGYALSNEVADAAGISIANFSMLKQYAERNNFDDLVLKFGNCTFIKVNDSRLPLYIKKALNFKYTDVGGLVLLSHLKSELNILERDVLKIFKDYSPEIIKIADKSFLKLSGDFMKLLNRCVTTTLGKKETMQCLKDKEIDGYLKLSSNNYLVWYKVL